MKEEDKSITKVLLHHKKEATTKIMADTEIRIRLLQILDICLHPSKGTSRRKNSEHHKWEERPSSVYSNVKIGKSTLENFERPWLVEFTIPSEIK